MIRFLPLVLLAVVANAAPAQTSRAMLEDVQHNNWIVRVDSIGPDRVRGFVNDSVILGSTRIAIAGISQIERQVRIGGAGGPAALAGAGVLGLLGILGMHEFCRPNCALRDIVGGAALGATLGATLGGFFGGAVKRGDRQWIRIWPTQ